MTQNETTSQPAPKPKNGVMLITNREQQPDESAAFDFVAALAATANVSVTLYDRSQETWGDSQHPEGPLGPDDSRLSGHEHLTDQLNWFSARAIPAQAWIATLPSISAALTALAETRDDVVVIPPNLDRNLFERVLQGSSLAETLAEQISRHPTIDASVWEMDAEQTVAVVGSRA